ncbi:MCP four helix bundle domain-containing protein [Pollutibacter soli]|uniref:MCP four helix bundle domain-containing protein n=1 Tax=Pollutibacter soli TaxID=3034157 RepID=UPI0030132461
MIADKHKPPLLVAIFLMIVMVLLTNFSDRKEYDHLDKTVSSIYNDRLIPSGYLFRIAHHLYVKNNVLEQLKDNSFAAQNTLRDNNFELKKLMASYEKTYLTPDEKKTWNSFKSTLVSYNQMENSLATDASLVSSAELTSTLNKLEFQLQELNEIQALEGKKLRSDSARIIDDTRLNALLEMALLFVICIALLRLSGFNERHHGLGGDRALLN